VKSRVISSLILGSVAVLMTSSASAATVSAATAEMLVEAFLGSSSNITVIPGSIEFIGAATQSGVYDNGMVMTTGSINHIPERHISTGTGSSALLASLAGASRTYDQNILSFSFTVNDASVNAISTNFFLASDEYPDWLGSQYRDVFGFYIDGVNYAHFPDGSRVVATETSDYVNGNDVGYNGKTLSYSLVGLLDPSLPVHTLTIGIADVGDAIYDSAVFIGSLSSFSCTNCTPGVTPGIPEPETYAMLLAGLGVVGVAAKRRRRG